MTIKADEALSILHNCSTVCDALIPVTQAASTGDITKTLNRMVRAQELIIQANKSTLAIISQIRGRYEDELPST